MLSFVSYRRPKTFSGNSEENIDKGENRQAVIRQPTSATPFMKVSDGYKSSNKKVVSFDNNTETNDKIDELTSLVSKMKVQMDKCDTKFKPQIYQSKRWGQSTQNYNDYGNRNISFGRDRNTSYRGRRNSGRNFRQNYRGRL